MTKRKTQKPAEWKIEPLTAPIPACVENLSATELVALLAAAYRRIVTLEAALSRA